VRAWDLAATEEGDWTCGVKLAKSAKGFFYVEDVIRGRWTPHARDQIILTTAQMDGTATAVWVEEEPGSSGKSVTASLVRLLQGFTIRAERTTGDKVTRAMPLAAQLEAGNVKLLKATWNQVFIEEFIVFPAGRHDDQVDACALAFNKLAGKRTWTVA
jgi:predicted phage terminase large subunit-like protein